MANYRLLGLAALLPCAVLAPCAVYSAELISIEQAQKLYFPSALVKPAFVSLSDAQKEAIKAQSGMRQRWDTQKVWRMEQGGQLQGWFIVDEVVGKHEFITYALALDNKGVILGVEVLEYRETHGGQIKSAAWRKNFVGKNRSAALKLDQDIPNISGATLSSRNVTDGVKRLLALHQIVLAGQP